jgi:predicted protein tyrosine phosphatase
MIVPENSHMPTTKTETTITTPGTILGTPTRPHRWTGNEQYQFLSRLAMSRYTGTQPYGVISITDPDAPRCSLRPDPHRRGVLRLQFWDLEDEAWTGRNPIWHLDPKDKFTQSHADQIHNFVRATRHNKLTIVHCEAGISRSSGVAAALATAANCPDTDRYFTTPPAHPDGLPGGAPDPTPGPDRPGAGARGAVRAPGLPALVRNDGVTGEGHAGGRSSSRRHRRSVSLVKRRTLGAVFSLPRLGAP